MTIDAAALFDAIRAIKGAPLHQTEVDAVNAALMPRADRLMALAVEHLSAEEGRVPYAYPDHLGYLTIGVGRLIDERKGGRLRDSEIDFMLVNDITDRIEAMKDWPAWQRVKDDPVRAVAMISLAFQLGTAGFAKFKASLAAIAKGEWETAAANLLASRWTEQTPARAKRVAAMMRTGRMA